MSGRTRIDGRLLIGGAFLGLILCIAFIPVPLLTRAQGVVRLAETSQIRALEDGFVVRLICAEESWVQPGEALIETEDPLLGHRIDLLEAKLSELQARLAKTSLDQRSQAQAVGDEIAVIEADLAHTRARVQALTLRSPAQGRLILLQADDLPGHFLRRGDLVGYVLDAEQIEVQAVVGQESVGLVRERTISVQVQLVDWQSEPIESVILRDRPAATDELPSPALGSAAGGSIPLDPRDDSGAKALTKFFVFDLALPDTAGGRLIGRRVEIRFDHGAEPLWQQWSRAFRQLFLSHFGT